MQGKYFIRNCFTALLKLHKGGGTGVGGGEGGRVNKMEEEVEALAVAVKE